MGLHTFLTGHMHQTLIAMRCLRMYVDAMNLVHTGLQLMQGVEFLLIFYEVTFNTERMKVLNSVSMTLW